MESLRKSKGNSARTPRESAEPVLGHGGAEVQKFDHVIAMPLNLPLKVCEKSVEVLNQILADTITLRDLYKKHHWQVSGVTFYQLHLLYDKHYTEQSAMVDDIAERIQLLGGISVAMAADIAEMTEIERPPRGREDVPVQLERLLEAHKLILSRAREGAEAADESGDLGTNDLLVSQVVRVNELQTWFLAEHLVALPLITAQA
jgi:starvation-inducible DNA-binding protein